MDDAKLHRLIGNISLTVRERLIKGTEPAPIVQEAVIRPDRSTIDLGVLDNLMHSISHRFAADQGTDRAGIDGWLAPRLHYALRLTRTEAADRGVWAWLALRYSDFVVWRWQDAKGVINEDRWIGRVNKQAMMRLWWGAELFRNGGDYTPAERAFMRQDLPNSYLHRPLVRCRSLALAIVDVIVPTATSTPRTAEQINDLARVLNLAMAGGPPELETDFQRDDHQAYRIWLEAGPVVPSSWLPLPSGPAASDTTERSLAGARSITARGWEHAIRCSGNTAR